MTAVEQAYTGRAGVENDHLHGLTDQSADGWTINLRPSNTEPLLRLNVEAPDEQSMARIRDDVLSLVRR
jgi:phosphomannomutase